MASKETKRDLDAEFAKIMGGAFDTILSNDESMPSVRKTLANWWLEMPLELRIEYKDTLRIRLNKVRRAAEAFTQELQSVSSRN